MFFQLWSEARVSEDLRLVGRGRRKVHRRGACLKESRSVWTERGYESRVSGTHRSSLNTRKYDFDQRPGALSEARRYGRYMPERGRLARNEATRQLRSGSSSFKLHLERFWVATVEKLIVFKKQRFSRRPNLKDVGMTTNFPC